MKSSSVVGCSIQSVNPTRNGLLDKAIGILNTIFNLMGAKTRDTIAIMWSSGSYEYDTNQTWLPNHFVPLLSSGVEISVIDISSVEDFPPLNSTTKDSKVVCSTIFDTTLKSQSHCEVPFAESNDFISLQLVSYPFVLFCMTIKYV